jgi:hypothetical protein
VTTVFIGGSRKISQLNDALRARAENITKGGLSVVIGDANGADKAMQGYLAKEGYRNVVVFCSGAECRNNLGAWPTRHIESERESRDFYFYTAKDVAMSEEADYGFMLWEGKSVGTLHNILNLVKRGKQVVVYFSPERTFITVSSFKDVELLVAKCTGEDITRFEKRLKLSNMLRNGQFELNLAK